MINNTQKVISINQNKKSSQDDIVPLLEAYLYQTDKPVSIEQLSKLTGFYSQIIRQALKKLEYDLENSKRGLMLAWSDNRVHLTVKPQFQSSIIQMNEVDPDKNIAVIDEYLYVIDGRGYSPQTIRDKKYKLNDFAKAVNKPLDEVVEKDIKYYLMNQKKKGNSKVTMANKFSTLKAFFSWMVIEELLDKNPMRKMEKPKTPEAPPKFLTYEELEILRETADELLDRTLIEVFYSSGIRVSEGVNLDWSDIDFMNKTLLVRNGKGGKTRTTFLSTKAVMLLKDYKKTRVDDKPWVFNSQWNGHNRMSRYTIGRRLRELGKKAGINKNVTPHRLRHSLATHMLDKGASEVDIQQILGHSSINTTMRYARANMSNVEHIYRKINP